MNRTHAVRWVVPFAFAAAVGACADAPTAPEAAGDPIVAAVNHRLADGSVIRRVDVFLQGERQDAPKLAPLAAAARAGAARGEVSAEGPFSIPFYCWSSSDSPWCPQIYIGAAVWGSTSVPGRATLYAHLDVMENAESSELSVSFAAVAGCSGSPGTFGGQYLTGGSNTPYALVASETHEFSGGQMRWRVNASGSAIAPWGTMIDAWTSATACY